MATEFTNLIDPLSFTVELALIMLGFMAFYAYFIVKLRHALLGITWGITVIVIGMIITVNLAFIWFWNMVIVMAIILSLAVLFRYFVIPARNDSRSV